MPLRIDDNDPKNIDAVAFLKERGYFTDDECYGKYGVEGNATELERVLRLHGYEGGKIETVAAFVSGNGNVYLAYDSSKLDLYAAMDVLNNYPTV